MSDGNAIAPQYGYGRRGGAPPDRASLIPAAQPDYLDEKKRGQVALALAAADSGQPTLLQGPKGCGKTSAVLAWANKNGYPVVRVDCHEEMSVGELTGSVRLEGGSTWVALGPLVLAAELSTQGPVVLCMEEVNALPPGVLKTLNPLLDGRRSVSVAPLGRTWVARQENLRVVGTCNPPSYAGTHAMPEDQISRWAVYATGWPSAALEKRILLAALTASPGSGVLEQDASVYTTATPKKRAVEDAIVAPLYTILEHSRSGSWEYALSPRDGVACVRVLGALRANQAHTYEEAIRGALWGLRGKVGEDEKALSDFDTRARAAFSVYAAP